jgi:hypothetical protein
MGQYGFSTNVPRPEISTALYERTFEWPVTGASGTIAQAGLIIVPKGYTFWNRGLDSCQFTGRSVFLKNITSQITFQFPKSSKNFEPYMFHFVTGFVKMGLQYTVAPTLGLDHTQDGFCAGMVLNYTTTDAAGTAADPIEIHAANVVAENVGQSHGSLNACGNVNRQAIVVTSDTHREIKPETLIDYDSEGEESSTISSRNDLVQTMVPYNGGFYHTILK